MISVLLASLVAHATDRLTYVTLDSAAERRPMTYGIYEPPGWDRTTPLPLVVFLHGGGDDERAWDDHPVVTRRLDAAITAGDTPPFIAVVPDGERGFWRNWADDSHRFEDWVVDEVLTDVRSRLPVLAGREHTHLMGISMGGMGTTYIGLEHLDTFGSLTILSAPLLDGDATLKFLDSAFLRSFAPVDRVFGTLDPDEVRANSCYALTTSQASVGDTTIWIGAGTADLPGIGKATATFHDHLTTSGVAHTYAPFPGGHQWTAWSKVFPVALARAMD